jgi:hypothetical protein
MLERKTLVGSWNSNFFRFFKFSYPFFLLSWTLLFPEFVQEIFLNEAQVSKNLKFF